MKPRKVEEKTNLIQRQKNWQLTHDSLRFAFSYHENMQELPKYARLRVPATFPCTIYMIQESFASRMLYRPGKSEFPC